MTENTAPAEAVNETAEEQAEAETPVLDRSILNEIAERVLQRIETPFNKAKEIAEKRNASHNVAELITEAIANSKNKKVVELRQKVAEANQFILDANKAMEAEVKPSLHLPTEEELAKLDTEYKELADLIDTYNGVFEQETSLSGTKYSVYDFLGKLPGKKRGAKVGQGQGVVRPRVQKIEITTDIAGEQGYKVVEKDGKSTFGLLAQFIKSATDGQVDYSATDFSDAWVKQNGGKDWQDLNNVTTFAVTATGENEKSYKWMVRVTK